MSFQNRSNQSGMNIPADQMQSLLGMAGKHLGKDPAQLKSQLESGQINQVLAGMDPQKAAQISRLLNDPQQLEQLLGSPQVKALLGGLMKQK